MKHQMGMPPVEDCTASNCAYNQDHKCYAKAITIGQSTHPACDTFLSDDTRLVPAHVVARNVSAGVGACKTVLCQHNDNLECVAPSIRVTSHATHADCVTFKRS